MDLDVTNKWLEEIITFCEEGKLKQSLTSLKHFYKKQLKSKVTSVQILEQRLGTNDKAFNQGVISREEHNIERNKIAKCILVIVRGDLSSHATEIGDCLA